MNAKPLILVEKVFFLVKIKNKKIKSRIFARQYS